MPSDPDTILRALLDPEAAEQLGEGAAWTGLLARGGRAVRAHLEDGLAQAEFEEGLYADESLQDEATRRLAADTDDDWPQRYTAGPWRLAVDLHPEGGVYARLEGPSSARLASQMLTPGVTAHVPDWALDGAPTLTLDDGEEITLRRQP